MKKDKGIAEKEDLRRRAEEKLDRIPEEEDLSQMSTEAMQHIVHDLRVHQIELEMQNEELRRVHQEIEASRNRYSDLYDFAPVGYVTASEKGMIREANLTICSMLGVERSLLIGKPFSRFITQETQDTYYFQRQKLFETKEKQSFELRLVKKDGSSFYAQLECLPVGDSGGNITQLRMALTNINARKLAQQALQKAHAELEQRVEERTAELRRTNTQLESEIAERKRAEAALRESDSKLRQAQKMESIGTLAGGIAHEFNNILGIIIGNTELAIDYVPEWNPTKECLNEIRAASMRAKDVVQHILSFAHKTPVQRKPVQISTITRNSLKLIRASIPTTIEIRQNISCESEMILADSTEINQILMNLCTNSVHALSEETGVIEVNLENEELRMKNEEFGLEPGRYVKLTVKDTGSGIEPKIMDRVFDPYFTTKDIGKGTGMGLAVAYGIVKKHDGAIKASSELGKGTVFEVLFPLIDEGAELEVEEEPQVLPTGTERILIVDDEPSLVRIVSQLLKRLGYDVVALLNPKEALELFMTEPKRFDLVITDTAMPLMAGDQLAQELMKIRKDIPVILCTGHCSRIDEDRAKELGLAAYVVKPVVKRDFAITVRKVLDRGIDDG